MKMNLNEIIKMAEITLAIGTDKASEIEFLLEEYQKYGDLTGFQARMLYRFCTR